MQRDDKRRKMADALKPTGAFTLLRFYTKSTGAFTRPPSCDVYHHARSRVAMEQAYSSNLFTVSLLSLKTINFSKIEKTEKY